MQYRQAFIEVIKELFSTSRGTYNVKPESTTRREFPAPVAAPLLSAVTVPPDVFDFSGRPDIGTHTEAFVRVPEARLFLRPVHAFDSVLTVVPYATPVRVMRHEGRFTSIEHHGVIGWVHKDELVYSGESIFPELAVGESYDAHHASTQAVRRYLGDDFFTESLYLPLLAVEYVSFMLRRNGRTLPWTMVRPRRAGTWHVLLRGGRGVHVGLAPHTGAVIEYDVPDGESVVGYVESVRPDGTLTVSTVGKDEEGVFVRYQLNEKEYRELRALFIRVT
ncbi:hypothetical protein K2Q16_04305 [Patescibacteria group bacterium]|nr:hypothetical protein [Patescibacteria group bacterium]